MPEQIPLLMSERSYRALCTLYVATMLVKDHSCLLLFAPVEDAQVKSSHHHGAKHSHPNHPLPRLAHDPCSRRLPLIGNLLHLLTPEPQVVLRDLAKKHGPVMCLQLGQVDAFIISSPAAAQEVLRDNNVNFASRSSILALEVSCYGNLDIAFSVLTIRRVLEDAGQALYNEASERAEGEAVGHQG
ncbi:hypothetical protein QYE76_046245 [Lolium multiflorum]|uniref:Uncharacterized protein n=1 Tax=Lolium multiflorum TaxID=4521 RepID=A0AAD8WY70_LOLMU|nr:hypothetical protein QYE76_046245 [Lolium multiflorum]